MQDSSIINDNKIKKNQIEQELKSAVTDSNMMDKQDQSINHGNSKNTHQ